MCANVVVSNHLRKITGTTLIVIVIVLSFSPTATKRQRRPPPASSSGSNRRRTVSLVKPELFSTPSEPLRGSGNSSQAVVASSRRGVQSSNSDSSTSSATDCPSSTLSPNEHFGLSSTVQAITPLSPVPRQLIDSRTSVIRCYSASPSPPLNVDTASSDEMPPLVRLNDDEAEQADAPLNLTRSTANESQLSQAQRLRLQTVAAVAARQQVVPTSIVAPQSGRTAVEPNAVAALQHAVRFA